MLQGSYGKEPFDLRLTVLRLLGKLHIIIGVTALGVLLFAGGYYVKNVVLREETLYETTSVYYVEYNVEKEPEVSTVHVNQTSWNTYVQTELFLNAVQAYLNENNTLSDGSRIELSNAELGATIQAYLASDLRVPSTKVTTDHPEKSVLIAQAVEKAMVGEMAESLREIIEMRVIDSAVAAEEVIPDVRVGRAVILSAVLSCFFVVLFLLLKETWEDNIYLPASIRKRYGLKCVGGLNEMGTANQIYATAELPQNMKYLFEGKRNVAVCPVSADMNPDSILEALKSLCPDEVSENWFVTPAPLLCPETCEELRKAEGILLAVNSGAREGKNFERVLEFLEQQDCKITAVVLTDVDVKLLKWYYLGMKQSAEK